MIIYLNINFLPKIKTVRTIYKYDKADWEKINDYFNKIPWSVLLYNMDNIEEMVDFLNEQIYIMMDKYIPTFTLSNNIQKNLAWIIKLKNV